LRIRIGGLILSVLLDSLEIVPFLHLVLETKLVILIKQALFVPLVKTIILVEIANQCRSILPQGGSALLGIKSLETLIWPEDVTHRLVSEGEMVLEVNIVIGGAEAHIFEAWAHTSQGPRALQLGCGIQ
jgi:hypothetical protein